MRLLRIALVFSLMASVVAFAPGASADGEPPARPADCPACPPCATTATPDVTPETGRAPVTTTPPPIIVIGTGPGDNLAVSIQNPITVGESSNRVNVQFTWLIAGFVVYESATDTTPKSANSLSIKVGGSEKARISKVGSQFHWLIADAGGTLQIPEVCETVNTNVNIPDCTAGSWGIPARMIDLASGVTLYATWTGQDTPKKIHHAELQVLDY